jgi:hypothetical protein
LTVAASVLVCVIELLGRSPRSLPPIELVAFPPPDVSRNAEAFVRDGSGTISLVTSAPAFRDADCYDRRSMLKLASVLVHEECHVRHGPEERRCYEAQLGALTRLGVAPDSGLYVGVVRSMSFVLKAQADAARLAARVRQEGSLATVERDP